MTNYWNLIKEKLLNEKGVLSIGFSDIIGAGISAGFWFYVAGLMFRV